MKLDHALHLARNGFRIFPLSPNSKVPPKDLEWRKVATTDPDAIRAWWEAVPSYNIGVAAGAGTFIVDADTKDGKPGLESLEALEMCGLPTDSLRVATPSGGVHVYLRSDAPHRNSVDKMPEYRGIDIRADGGYVVGPGSTIDGATYEVVGTSTEVRPSPTWFDEYLVNLQPQHAPRTDTPVVELDQQRHIDQAVEYLVERAPEAIEGAGGDQTTFEVASACRDYGLSPEMTLDVMLEHWNEAKASPPWQPDDLKDKVANAYRYATGTWGGRSLGAELSAFGVVDIGEDDGPVAAGEAPSKSKIQILDTLDYASMLAMPDPEWLVEDILQQGTAGLVFGQSNAFKSFLGIDLGLCAHTGRPWHGKQVKKTNVLFVVTEGAKGVAKQRIPGWMDYHEIPEGERASLRMFPRDISLDNGDAVKLLIATMRHFKIGLAIFDIFGGTMDGTEVEDTTARAWVKNMQNIIRETGATTLTVAHTGWQDKTRARMHTHFWGSFDTRIKIEGDKEGLTSVLSIDRHKDADSTGKYGFRLEKFGPTLVPVLDQGVTQAPADLSAAQRTALDALIEAISLNGVVNFEEGFPAGKVAPVESWRERCEKRGLTTSKKKNSRDQAFIRARAELLKRKLIVELDGYAWPAEAT